MANETRLTARIPSSVKETLQKAADLSGATLNQFLVQAALKEAHLIIESDRAIELSERDASLVFELIDNPPEANSLLKAAFQKHQQFFDENS
jgi:uncharacterized protein (DUF1778 family)